MYKVHIYISLELIIVNTIKIYTINKTKFRLFATWLDILIKTNKTKQVNFKNIAFP